MMYCPRDQMRLYLSKEIISLIDRRTTWRAIAAHSHICRGLAHRSDGSAHRLYWNQAMHRPPLQDKRTSPSSLIIG